MPDMTYVGSDILPIMKGGQLIREARRRAGLSQAELAARLGTSQAAVARWETGRTAPSFETVVRAIRGCGLDLVVGLGPYDDHNYVLALQNLRLSPAKRLEKLTAFADFVRTVRRAKPVASRKK